MVTLERPVLERFREEGRVVVEGLLDAQEDLQPIIDEYTELLDRLADAVVRRGQDLKRLRRAAL